MVLTAAATLLLRTRWKQQTTILPRIIVQAAAVVYRKQRRRCRFSMEAWHCTLGKRPTNFKPMSGLCTSGDPTTKIWASRSARLSFNCIHPSPNRYENCHNHPLKLLNVDGVNSKHRFGSIGKIQPKNQLLYVVKYFCVSLLCVVLFYCCSCDSYDK